MTVQDSSSPEVNLPVWLDPFPEPHTLPPGWDLDNIVPSLQPPDVERVDTPAEDPFG